MWKLYLKVILREYILKSSRGLKLASILDWWETIVMVWWIFKLIRKNQMSFHGSKNRGVNYTFTQIRNFVIKTSSGDTFLIGGKSYWCVKWRWRRKVCSLLRFCCCCVIMTIMRINWMSLKIQCCLVDCLKMIPNYSVGKISQFNVLCVLYTKKEV